MFIISRTPVRISFFGGGSDYPDFYLEEGGAVLGTTIDQYNHISVKTLKSNFFDHSIRISYSKTEHVKHVEEIEHPSIRESLKFKNILGNLEIHIFSDLPARTGLGSSSAFTVGFLHALYALEGREISKQLLAEEACHIEQKLICENVGSQDQFHAAFGGFNVIEFKKEGTIVRSLCFEEEKKAFLEEHLLVFYTGLTRHATLVVKEQIERTKRGLNAIFLRKMREMVVLAESVLVEKEAEEMIAAFGTLLHESWCLKKALSNSISSPFIDACYEAAIQAGAYGGKLCGAGSGGFLAFIVPKKNQSAVRKALSKLSEVIFKFENEGSTIIYKKGLAK